MRKTVVRHYDWNKRYCASHNTVTIENLSILISLHRNIENYINNKIDLYYRRSYEKTVVRHYDWNKRYCASHITVNIEPCYYRQLKQNYSLYKTRRVNFTFFYM